MSEIHDELRIRPVRAGFLLALTTAWSLWTLAGITAQTDAPPPTFIVVGYPVALVALLVAAERQDSVLKGCAAWAGLLLSAAFLAALVFASPLLALAPLGLLASAGLCLRFPAGTAIGLFALTGFYGSLQAFMGLSGALPVDILLGGMWTALALLRIADMRTPVTVVWPAMLVVGLYIAVTVVDVLTAESVIPAVLSFRLSTWYLLAVVLFAYSGFSRETYGRIARGAVVVGLLVGAYATLRWFIGPAASEFQFARGVGGAFNFVDGELRTFGSFGSGHQLGFWTGAVAPFCLAASLGWRGTWRLIAAAAFGFLVFAVLASEVRGAFVGLVLGTGVVVVLYQLARGTPSLNPVRAAVVSVTCLGLLAGTLIFTAGDGGIARYDAILDPSNDPAYLRRAQKLDAALPEIRAEPLGHGIGTASLNPSLRPPFRDVATYSLDNSFLRIAYEQGMPVMILFAVALAVLLLRLITGSTRAPNREAATMGIGAAGTLAAAAALLYSGMYNEDLLVLGAWTLVGLGSGGLLREESASVTAVTDAEEGIEETDIRRAPPGPRPGPAPLPAR